MDVRPTSNKYDNNAQFPINSKQFSFETYFVWFSALIFLTEIITGKLKVPLK